MVVLREGEFQFAGCSCRCHVCSHGLGVNLDVSKPVHYLDVSRLVYCVGIHVVCFSLDTQDVTFLTAVDDAEVVYALDVNHRHNVLAIAYKSVQGDIQVAILSTSDFERRWTLSLSDVTSVASIAFNADSTLIAVQGGEPDFVMAIYVVHRCSLVASVRMRRAVNTVQFHPTDPHYVVSCGPLHLKLWKLAKNELRGQSLFASVQQHCVSDGVHLTCVGWGSTNGILAGTSEGSVFIFELATFVCAIDPSPSFLEGGQAKARRLMRLPGAEVLGAATDSSSTLGSKTMKGRGEHGRGSDASHMGHGSMLAVEPAPIPVTAICRHGPHRVIIAGGSGGQFEVVELQSRGESCLTSVAVFESGDSQIDVPVLHIAQHPRLEACCTVYDNFQMTIIPISNLNVNLAIEKEVCERGHERFMGGFHRGAVTSIGVATQRPVVLTCEAGTGRIRLWDSFGKKSIVMQLSRVGSEMGVPSTMESSKGTVGLFDLYRGRNKRESLSSDAGSSSQLAMQSDVSIGSDFGAVGSGDRRRTDVVGAIVDVLGADIIALHPSGSLCAFIAHTDLYFGMVLYDAIQYFGQISLASGNSVDGGGGQGVKGDNGHRPHGARAGGSGGGRGVVDKCRALCFSPGGDMLAASCGGTITVIEVYTQRIVAQIDGHTFVVNALAWNVHGTSLLSVAGGKCIMWQMPAGNKFFTSYVPGLKFIDVAVHPNGKDYFVVSETGELVQICEGMVAYYMAFADTSGGTSSTATSKTAPGLDGAVSRPRGSVQHDKAGKWDGNNRRGRGRREGGVAKQACIPTCCRVTRDGSQLLVGMANGVVHMYALPFNDSSVVDDGQEDEDPHAWPVSSTAEAVERRLKMQATSSSLGPSSTSGVGALGRIAKRVAMEPFRAVVSPFALQLIELSADHRYLYCYDVTGAQFMLHFDGCAYHREHISKQLVDPDRCRDYTIVTSTAFERYQSRIADLEGRIKENETQCTLTVSLLEAKYTTERDDLEKTTVEALNTSKMRIDKLREALVSQEKEHAAAVSALEGKHSAALAEREAHYEERLRQESDRYNELAEQMVDKQDSLREDNKRILRQARDKLQETVDVYEGTFDESRAEVKRVYEEMAHMKHVYEEELAQIEEEREGEVLRLQSVANERIMTEKDKSMTLRAETSLLRGRFETFTAEQEKLRHVIADRDREVERLQKQTQDLDKTIVMLERALKERDETVSQKEQRIFELKQKNKELDKFRFVLDYKLTELKRDMDPKERQVLEMTQQIEKMDEELQRRRQEVDQLKNDIKERQLRGQAVDRQRVHLQNKVLNSERTSRAFIQELVRVHEEAKNGHWKEGLRHLYDVFITNGDQFEMPADVSSMTGSGATAASGSTQGIVSGRTPAGSKDVLSEIARQREFMERSLQVLRANAHKSGDQLAAEMKHKVDENTLLIHELNELRRERDQLSRTVRRLQNDLKAAGLSAGGGGSLAVDSGGDGEKKTIRRSASTGPRAAGKAAAQGPAEGGRSEVWGAGFSVMSQPGSSGARVLQFAKGGRAGSRSRERGEALQVDERKGGAASRGGSIRSPHGQSQGSHGHGHIGEISDVGENRVGFADVISSVEKNMDDHRVSLERLSREMNQLAQGDLPPMPGDDSDRSRGSTTSPVTSASLPLRRRVKQHRLKSAGSRRTKNSAGGQPPRSGTSMGLYRGAR